MGRYAACCSSHTARPCKQAEISLQFTRHQTSVNGQRYQDGRALSIVFLLISGYHVIIQHPLGKLMKFGRFQKRFEPGDERTRAQPGNGVEAYEYY
jgi:hypothetical protein